MTAKRYEIDDEIYLTNILTKEDVVSFVKYLNNPTIYANTLRIPYPYIAKHGEDFIERMNSSTEPTLLFTIRLKKTNELIGECCLYGSTKNERIAEIGYWLGEPYWHRGLVSKAVTKVIEIAKIEWKNLVRIEAHIFCWNKASQRVAEKCGFHFEGLLRKRLHKDGQDIDVTLYAYIIE